MLRHQKCIGSQGSATSTLKISVIAVLPEDRASGDNPVAVVVAVTVAVCGGGLLGLAVVGTLQDSAHPKTPVTSPVRGWCWRGGGGAARGAVRLALLVCSCLRGRW